MDLVVKQTEKDNKNYAEITELKEKTDNIQKIILNKQKVFKKILGFKLQIIKLSDIMHKSGIRGFEINHRLLKKTNPFSKKEFRMSDGKLICLMINSKTFNFRILDMS